MTNACRLIITPRAGQGPSPGSDLSTLAGLWFELAVAQEGSSDGRVESNVRLPDGRVFVTDGAFTLDVELAKPRVLPGTELPSSVGEVMGRYMAAE
jgi:hypothetical protein